MRLATAFFQKASVPQESDNFEVDADLDHFQNDGTGIPLSLNDIFPIRCMSRADSGPIPSGDLLHFHPLCITNNLIEIGVYPYNFYA